MSSLSDLQRDELVYVTCGEPWSDPQLSYSEQQRRTVLANLAADISHIRQYCALRDPAGITVHLKFPLASGIVLLLFVVLFYLSTKWNKMCEERRTQKKKLL